MSATPGGHACAHTLDRRAFLRQTAGFAGTVLVGLGAAPALAEAMVSDVRGREMKSGLTGARLREYALPMTNGGLVDADNEVLLVRWAGRVLAFSLTCPHRGATLHWQGDSSGALCPKHKARFAPDGANTGGRRTRALDRYPIRREGSRVIIDLDAPLEQDADAATWAAAWVSVE